ncbi:Os04g0417400 [Oryza sativa Japonica Group]|uniref:U-box domain-containing protein n=1 Tax=Oryza sativa subsp. japonica TaxID=39947 RepID=Q7XUY9_ORYSJ|nr:putative U-box domain-containing protein [Oryza sativa Japonica Group]BAF14683.1 Os04g0417400 [Oryza sativa Japonica Group]CAD40926.3 OSJNBa0033G16.8 [Oryza sativa Japonica Group]|eukprot:NP_001052769.1 Os04g0417400 [Oryza sativa Japonica Group]
MGEESSPAAAPAVEVLSYFVCPISLEIMRDPVTLSTGITYDRESIERWVFTDGHGECPVTKQRLAPADREPTPNHTLRRLIQGWCAVHAVERFPTPRPPVDAARVAAIVDAARPLLRRRRQREELMASLRELADIVAESDRNRRCVQGASGAVEFLLSVVKERASVAGVDDATSAKPEETTCGGVHDPAKASSPEEAALSILHSLKLSEESFKRVLEGSGGEDFLETMACVLRRPSYLSRMQGIHLLKSALPAMAPARLTSARAALVDGVVGVVADRPSAKAVKVALHVLCRLCPWARNRVKAVDAGAVSALVRLLLDEGCGGGGGDRRACELAAVAIDHICRLRGGAPGSGGAPGGAQRQVACSADRCPHTAGAESAVRALHAVARHSATSAVLQEMLPVGVVARLLFLVQVGASGERTRARAREMLKMHARVWRDSPCLASHLNASYPR